MRFGGFTVIALVFLSALVRVWTPQTSMSGSARPGAAAGSGGGKSEQQQGANQLKAREHLYPIALSEKIRDFFGEEHSPDSMGQVPPCSKENFDYWCVPKTARENLRFIVATVPDPIHTHLSLFFDRSVDAIIQGINSQKYFLDRSVMPWHYFGDPNSDETRDEAKLRESFPGLMIFRSDAKPPLFVLVVGEAPTSGINQEQFHHALNIIRDIRKGITTPMSPTVPEYGILGPTFSGSLYSLSGILNTDRTKPGSPLYSDARTLPAYATVMGTLSIGTFQMKAPEYVRMAIFEEDAATVFNALLSYATELGYRGNHIAVLSEDETAYGGSLSPDSEILNLSFPRGISQFRSEYSSELQTKASQDDTGNGNAQAQRNLRLDLEVTGSDDDTVAPYAKSQIPQTQEGVMLGLLSELRLRQPKFILLRATDPLDELFLARYLREKYPQGRLVVPTPDLLFPRDEAGYVDGVLGLNTYPLAPAALNPSCVDNAPILFPSSSGAALFNAAAMLVQRFERPAPKGRSNAIFPTGSGVKPDMVSCLSPNLWLTIVNGNTIHPIKVLHVGTGSAFFPTSTKDRTSENRQLDTRIPATWWFPFAFCLALSFLHFFLSSRGGTFGEWLTPAQLDSRQQPFQRKAVILWMGGIILAGILIVLVCPNTPGGHESFYTVIPWLCPVALFVLFIGINFWRRKERLLCVFLIVAAALLAAGSLSYASSAQQEMVLWRQRTLDLFSGISPVTPLLLLLLSFYAWFWYSLRGESLVEWRSPQLPEAGLLRDRYFRWSDAAAEPVREVIRPFSGPAWIACVSMLAVILLSIPVLFVSPGHLPLRSLEGWSFDAVYCFLLGIALVAFLSTLLRISFVWHRFRTILTALDRPGFKGALQRLSGFEWNVIWNPAWSMEKEGYKLIAREIQTVERLGESLGAPENLKRDEDVFLSRQITEIGNLRDQLVKNVRGSAGLTPVDRVSTLMAPFKQVLTKFAQTAGFLYTNYLEVSWAHLPAENDSKSGGEGSGGSATKVNVVASLIRVGPVVEPGEPAKDPCGLSSQSMGLAEEFVGGVYANFLVMVLLRIRGLVFSAVAIYVCVVFSTISYPFEPAPELSTLAIVLFLVGGLVIGYVYEEMHRDPTLSRMTSTSPGKLDTAFWTKFAAAGFVPVIALVSTVYPPFGHLLYSLVGPLLQALR